MIGGIIVLGGGFGLHQAGILKLTPEQDQQVTSALSAAEQKIAELEQKLGDLSANATDQSAGQALAALETKVSSLESALESAASAASSDVTPAIDALKQDFESLRNDVASAGSAASGGASVDLKPLENRLDALEGASGQQASVDLNPLEDRLSKLETEAAASTSQTDTLSGSVSGLETELGGLKTQFADVQNRLQNTEATAKAAQTAVSTSDVSLKTLADSQARATETLSSLSSDISSVGAANTAALESIRAELDSLSKRLQQVEGTMGDATAREVAARALSVSALKSAVDSGRPYETELAAVKAGLPADIDVQALESHAKTGVEPVSVLIAQFPPVARSIYQTFSEPDHSDDVLDSLLASARSIVAVRGPGDADGTGPEAALRRMENAVSNGDLSGAIAAYQELPDAAKAAGSDWVARAEARVQVDGLTEKASQEVLNALAAKDS
ncbi:MAG: mitofilin family membrane protein [Pseudomonadota bacterium]